MRGQRDIGQIVDDQYRGIGDGMEFGIACRGRTDAEFVGQFRRRNVAHHGGICTELAGDRHAAADTDGQRRLAGAERAVDQQMRIAGRATDESADA